MRPFRKGRRLIALCEQKTQNLQRSLAQLNSLRKKLLEQIAQCESELCSLEQALISLHINNVSVMKADIYQQRKRQAILLYQRQQINLERDLHLEDFSEIERDIQLHQKQLIILMRKEMKFTKWTQQERQKWLQQLDSGGEDENQDVLPWLK